MKKNLFTALILPLFLLIYVSGSAQDNPIFRHIAPDADAVYHINTPVLTAKLSWSEMIAALAIVHKQASNPDLIDVIKDPSIAGIDVQKDILITQSSEDQMDSIGNNTVILSLSDSSKFRTFLRKEFQGLRITIYPNRSYSASKNKMGVAWNDHLAVIVIARSDMKDKLDRMAGDKDRVNPRPRRPGPNYGPSLLHRSLAVLKGFDAGFFTTDPAFKAAFSDNADIHIYTKKGNYFKSLWHMMPSGVPFGMYMDSMSTINSTISSIRFEAGKITMHSRSTVKPEMATEMAKLNLPPFSAENLARLPKGNLLGAANLRLDLSMMHEMLNKFGFRKKIDSALAAKGLSMDDICHAFKGDFLLAALAPEHVDSTGKPKPVFYFVAAINDPAALHKLGDMLKSAKDSTSGDSTGKRPAMLSKIGNNFAVKDNILVISGSKEKAEDYLNNTEKRNTDFITDRMKEDPTFIWVDLKALVDLLFGPAGNSEGADKQMSMLHAAHALDRLIITGGAVRNGESNNYLELKMIDQKENGLKSLLNIMH